MLSFLQRNWLWCIISFVFLVVVVLTRVHWHPYWNHYFGDVEYSYPEEGEVFVVHVEPYGYELPQFAKYVIEHAFPEWTIVYDNTKVPHLVIRSEWFSSKDLYLDQYIQHSVPYISISEERYSLKKKRYRRNGLPLLELVSASPRYARQFHFPYLVRSELPFTRDEPVGIPEKLAAAVSSRCEQIRMNMFYALKASSAEVVEGYGRCFNNILPGYFKELDSIYSQYKFGFAMENHKVPGYVTEKLLNVWRSGAVPIYWGDSEWVGRYFNPKAYVDVSHFDSLEAAANYIVELSQDVEAYEAMRNQPLFQDNQIDELFYANIEKQNKYTEAAGLYLRKEFDRVVRKAL